MIRFDIYKHPNARRYGVALFADPGSAFVVDRNLTKTDATRARNKYRRQFQSLDTAAVDAVLRHILATMNIEPDSQQHEA